MIWTASPGSKASPLADRLKRGIRSLAVEESGAAMLDFAIVAVPFFMLLIGILEVAMVMFTQTQLQGATNTAAREIRTGVVQKNAAANGTDPEADFRTALCGQLIAAIACDTRLVVDVRAADSFGDITFPTYHSPNGNANGNAFGAGNGGQTVVIRVAYTWSVMTPMLEYYLANNGAGGRIITATAIFQNEPF